MLDNIMTLLYTIHIGKKVMRFQSTGRGRVGRRGSGERRESGESGEKREWGEEGEWGEWGEWGEEGACCHMTGVAHKVAVL